VAITVVGTPQAVGVIDGNDATLTFDVAPQEGDVTVLAGGHFNRGPLGPVTAGYTAAHESTAQNPYFGVWYKRQGATPDTNVVGDGSGFAQDATAYVALVLRGVDATTPLDVAAQAVASTDPAAITTVTADAFILVATGSQSGDNTPAGITGYTVTGTATATDTNRTTVRGAYKTLATPGTEDPAQWDGWTPDPGNSYSVTVAFRPAGGGSAQTVSPSGIASAAALGTPTINPTYTLTPTGIASSAAMGTPTVSAGTVTIQVAAMTRAPALGTPTVNDGTIIASQRKALQAELNRLANGDYPATYKAVQGAANQWAGTDGKALQGALNTKAGTEGLAPQGALNARAGTSGLAEQAAAAENTP